MAKFFRIVFVLSLMLILGKASANEAQKPVVVIIGADWCGPCKSLHEQAKGNSWEAFKKAYGLDEVQVMGRGDETSNSNPGLYQRLLKNDLFKVASETPERPLIITVLPNGEVKTSTSFDTMDTLKAEVTKRIGVVRNPDAEAKILRELEALPIKKTPATTKMIAKKTTTQIPPKPLDLASKTPKPSVPKDCSNQETAQAYHAGFEESLSGLYFQPGISVTNWAKTIENDDILPEDPAWLNCKKWRGQSTPDNKVLECCVAGFRKGTPILADYLTKLSTDTAPDKQSSRCYQDFLSSITDAENVVKSAGNSCVEPSSPAYLGCYRLGFEYRFTKLQENARDYKNGQIEVFNTLDKGSFPPTDGEQEAQGHSKSLVAQ